MLTIVLSGAALAGPQNCGGPMMPACVGSQHTTYYDVAEPPSKNGTGNGDNFIRLINPTQSTVCAMFYVFDNDSGGMNQCCGCLVQPETVQSYSVEINLNGPPHPAGGEIEILSTLPNIPSGPRAAALCRVIPGGCAPGCDPTRAADPSRAISGYILHNQTTTETMGLPEVPLLDVGDADDSERNALTQRCNLVIGNSTTGRCSCPNQPVATPE